MGHPDCKADLLSIPPLLAKLLNKQYHEEDDLLLRVSSRAYMMGDLNVGRTASTRKLISVSATPMFHGNPRFTSVMYRERASHGDFMCYHFGEIRVLFSVSTSTSTSAKVVEDDAPMFALVRQYDQDYPSLSLPSSASGQLSHACGYGALLKSWEPTSAEDAYIVGCMQLKLLGRHLDRVIPLSWIMQEVMVIPAFTNPASGISYLNKWYWKE